MRDDGAERELQGIRGYEAKSLSVASSNSLVAHCGGFGSRLARLALAGVGLALALHAGRLVMLAPLGLGEQSILLYPAGKLFQRGLEGVTFSNNHFTHA